MSNAAITWAYKQPVTPSGAKFVLVTLADYADVDGYCYPGQEKLADLTSQSERAVRGHLDAMVRDGVLLRATRYDRRGRRTSDGYLLVGFTGLAADSAAELLAEHAGREARYRQPASDSPADSAGHLKEEPLGEPLDTTAASTARTREAVGGGDETTTERQVLDRVLAIPLIGRQPRCQVLAHYREIVRIRGPRSPAAEIADALKFLHRYTDEAGLMRRSMLDWRLAMTNHFERTRETDDGRQRASTTPHGAAAAAQASPGRGIYSDWRAERPVTSGVRHRIAD